MKMRPIISLALLLIMLFGFCSCEVSVVGKTDIAAMFKANKSTDGVTISVKQDCGEVNLREFTGRYILQIPKENVVEGNLYCYYTIISGEADISYDFGVFSNTYQWFTTDVGQSAPESTYLDASVTKATIVIECTTPTTGIMTFKMGTP